MEPNLSRWQDHLITIATAGGQDDDAAHDISHLTRVWAAASQMLNAHPEADPLVVLSACYLHDLVNLPKNHPDRARASTMAASKAVQALSALGFPSDKLAAVAHAIEAHSFSAGIAPTTIEAKIVQDADRLDALGPVGLARMFHVGGALGRALAHPEDPMGLHRKLDDSLYTLDHIEIKLIHLPDTMQTRIGREIGLARVAWLRQFREDFVAGWTGAQLRAAN